MNCLATNSAALFLGLTALAPAAGAQSVAQGSIDSAPPEQRQWSRLDGIALEVDERVVTWSEFAQTLSTYRERTSVQTREELDQLYGEVTAFFLRQSLAQQAGSEMDLPRDRLDAILAQRLEEQRAPAGALGYGEALRGRGVDPLGEFEATRQNAFQIAYENEVLGRAGLGVERPRVDRFVRPGELKAFHAQFSEMENSPVVRLRLLDVSSAATGGLEQARQLCEQLLTDLEGGTSFDELFEVYGTRFRETLGVRPPTAAAQLEDPGLRNFAEAAEPGSYSAVLPYRLPESSSFEPDGYRIATLLTREAPREAPAFENLEFQRTLRNRLLQDIDRRRLARANARRFDQSHVWVHPILNTSRRP